MANVVARMRIAGCDDIRVVTRPDKQDVIAYAGSAGLDVILSSPGSVSESVLAGVEGVGNDRIVLLGFPDTIWEPPDGFRRLVEVVERGWDVALGLFMAPEPDRSDVVTVTSKGRVSSVQVKPSSPSSSLIWGCAAARRDALEELRLHPQPGFAFDALGRRGKVAGCFLSDSWVDIGTPQALADYVEGLSD